MNRPTTLFGTALLAATVVALAAIAGGVTAAPGPGTVQQIDANDTTANETAPGARLAGVVGIQQAEVTGDLDNRTFGLRVANADSDEERAAIIAERQNETQAQVAEQADRLADLRDARANGNISDAEYRARVATVAAQAADAERDADQLNRTASDLPEAVRERNNINVSAIEQLRSEARDLGGPETAEIARSIGGTAARNPFAGDARGPLTEPPGADRSPRDGSQAGPAGERGGVDAEQNGEQDRTQQSAERDRTNTQDDTERGSGNDGSDNARSGNGGSDNAGNSNRP